MRQIAADCFLRTVCINEHTNFLDATEEEVADLIQSMLKEVSIMASFIEMPAHNRAVIRELLALCDEQFS